MFKGLYDERRATQSVAYLLHLGGGEMDLLKLTKLIYLAEKRSYETYGEPLTGDVPYSLDHGPVLTSIYDSTKASQPQGAWSEWLGERRQNTISAARILHDPNSELKALSRADFKILEAIWDEFGGMTTWKLREWTHEHCPEWHDPEGSSTPINPGELLESVGLNGEEGLQQQEFLRNAGMLRSTIAASR